MSQTEHSPFFYTGSLLHRTVEKLLTMPALKRLNSTTDEELRRLAQDGGDPESQQNAEALLLAREVFQNTQPYPIGRKTPSFRSGI